MTLCVLTLISCGTKTKDSLSSTDSLAKDTLSMDTTKIVAETAEGVADSTKKSDVSSDEQEIREVIKSIYSDMKALWNENDDDVLMGCCERSFRCAVLEYRQAVEDHLIEGGGSVNYNIWIQGQEYDNPKYSINKIKVITKEYAEAEITITDFGGQAKQTFTLCFIKIWDSYANRTLWELYDIKKPTSLQDNLLEELAEINNND